MRVEYFETVFCIVLKYPSVQFCRLLRWVYALFVLRVVDKSHLPQLEQLAHFGEVRPRKFAISKHTLVRRLTNLIPHYPTLRCGEFIGEVVAPPI